MSKKEPKLNKWLKGWVIRSIIEELQEEENEKKIVVSFRKENIFTDKHITENDYKKFVQECFREHLKGICKIKLWRIIEAKEGDFLSVVLEVKNRKELYWRAGKFIDEKVEEFYGTEKEENELGKEIANKCRELNNKTILIKEDFPQYSHIRYFKTIRKFEKNDLLKVDDIFIEFKPHYSEFKIKITTTDKFHERFKPTKRFKEERLITEEGLIIRCHTCGAKIKTLTREDIENWGGQSLNCKRCSEDKDVVEITKLGVDELSIMFRVDKKKLLELIEKKNKKSREK